MSKRLGINFQAFFICIMGTMDLLVNETNGILYLLMQLGVAYNACDEMYERIDSIYMYQDCPCCEPQYDNDDDMV